ncbi:mechanosensitive ion channel domain-containing protein [Syntrophotalea acetylenica]|uniref:mechanosensitive ion channel family protein n=1 Tax=Syntrophotalea acetylenica TaxID=29542 RepID=UPI002A35F04F|nr:mechanosensitive ion channel domain-containing protein [Syntrophotalea acetylenica]MDY0263456.1 mechanosensitive ion channel [Syntrophotalea acetylenica]
MDIEIREWFNVLIPVGILILGALIGGVLHKVLFRILDKLAAKTQNHWLHSIVRNLEGPARLLLPLALLLLITPSLRLTDEVIAILRHIFSLLFIGGLSWLMISAVFVSRDLILHNHSLDSRNNLRARMIYTQVNVLVKIMVMIICLIGASSMLMTFEKIRQIGVSLLASAGIAGIIVGFAAQKSLATLFAGIQIALTQPIRIDDVVIVEGEWGRIEEITLTYVVVRIWDLRRLVVPITYFIDNTFQNWTRVSADILGTVFIYADYRLPVEALREQLHVILKDCEDWDGKVWGLQVTGTDNQTMELRALMSARDAGTAWDLRCAVREKLLSWLQSNYPECLPRVRAEVDDLANMHKLGGERTPR